MIFRIATGLTLMAVASNAAAKPHFDEASVPKVEPTYFFEQTRVSPLGVKLLQGSEEIFEVLRVRVDWNEQTDTYELGNLSREQSGTKALNLRSKNEDMLGSYRARLVSQKSGSVLSHDSIATGAHYRKLTRAISFRFPLPNEPVRLEVIGEDHESGEMKIIVAENISIPQIMSRPKGSLREVRVLKMATAEPVLRFNIYADGYLSHRRDAFFRDAARTVEAVEEAAFSGLDHFEFRAVFKASDVELGAAKELKIPVEARKSAMGLYYPSWDKFGRWYHVVYPTSEEMFRQAAAEVAYDYIFVLLDSSEYWGVGNYREFTAVPAGSFSFKYLVQHELGHYFGLNEEYAGGGPTELAFAPLIQEPWSQNITFLKEPSALKWQSFVKTGTSIPTNESSWNGSGPYGAYQGGYAETEPFGESHKPGLSCTMDRAARFCEVCLGAIADRVQFDLGNK